MNRAEREKLARNGAQAPLRPRPLAWRLVVLCAMVTLPIFAFVALLLTQYAESARLRLEREGVQAVRDVAKSSSGTFPR